jgi:hypothetical protein
MMSQTGIARAGSAKRARLTVATFMAIGVSAVGLLGPASASADPGDNNCSFGGTTIACVGQINGGLVNVNVGDVASNNDLDALENNLNNAFVAVANIGNINILSAQLNTAVQTIVTTLVSTTSTVKTCTPLVVPPPVPTGTSTITITCS